jgi:hypothetical protein
MTLPTEKSKLTKTEGGKKEESKVKSMLIISLISRRFLTKKVQFILAH